MVGIDLFGTASPCKCGYQRGNDNLQEQSSHVHVTSAGWSKGEIPKRSMMTDFEMRLASALTFSCQRLTSGVFRGYLFLDFSQDLVFQHPLVAGVVLPDQPADGGFHRSLGDVVKLVAFVIRHGGQFLFGCRLHLALLPSEYGSLFSASVRASALIRASSEGDRLSMASCIFWSNRRSWASISAIRCCSACLASRSRSCRRRSCSCFSVSAACWTLRFSVPQPFSRERFKNAGNPPGLVEWAVA